MQKAHGVIEEVGKELTKITGRDYHLAEGYRTEDAERIVVALGSTTGTGKQVVDNLREKGEKVGLVKIRMFRPFPYEEVRRILSGARAVGVLDRSASFGATGGPVMLETKAALYGESTVPIKNYIYGLGGRDITEAHIESVFEELKDLASSGRSSDDVGLLGVRE
jgi:pyruvate ferredoxin oxidoreductase alpha subunit